jgi:biopolymer transport protein ExbD
MLTRAVVSDETLLSYSVGLAGAATVVLVLIALGAFVYNGSLVRSDKEGFIRQADSAGTTAAAKARGLAALLVPSKKQTITPTMISLSADGNMLVNANPFPREEVALVFAETLTRKPVPPLFIRCERNVKGHMLVEIMAKAREVGIQEVRLTLVGEAAQP